MRWRGRRGSANIEDRRGRARGGAVAGGVGGLGLVALLLFGYFFGVDVSPLVNQQQVNPGGSTQVSQADQQAAEFVSVTLADTEDIWAAIFRDELRQTYNEPTLVLFKGVTPSPCGNASGATGPFYCPNDRKVYLDTDFFVTLSRRFGARGDFAAAYVVAHEVAHHVQDELGILAKANEIRSQVSQADSNAISVRIELQADCFAGIWARHAEERFGTLEDGDVLEAMNAAKQIGDDQLQRSAGRIPSPHTFTHGTSVQRQRWFATGYESGDLRNCDTFGSARL